LSFVIALSMTETALDCHIIVDRAIAARPHRRAAIVDASSAETVCGNVGQGQPRLMVITARIPGLVLGGCE